MILPTILSQQISMMVFKYLHINIKERTQLVAVPIVTALASMVLLTQFTLFILLSRLTQVTQLFLLILLTRINQMLSRYRFNIILKLQLSELCITILTFMTGMAGADLKNTLSAKRLKLMAL